MKALLATLLMLAAAQLCVRADLLIDPAGGTVLWDDARVADDAVLTGRELGFEFPWFDGESRTTIDVSTNGHLNADGDSDYANERAPGAIARIAPLWDDFEVRAGSGDLISERRIPGSVYAVTWRVHQQGSSATRHVFQVAIFGRATSISGIPFQAGDIVFSYGAIGMTFGKDSATVAIVPGADSIIPAAGTTPVNGTLGAAAAGALPTGRGSYILFRAAPQDGYKATTVLNQAPQPGADFRYLGDRSPVTIDPLENDRDPDGTLLEIASVSQGQVGDVMISSDRRTLVYAPGENFTGNDEFTYTVRDPFGLTGTATVKVLPFVAARGTFDGLVADLPLEEATAAELTADGVGRLHLVIGPRGTFTGTLTFGKTTVPLRGSFDATGAVSGSFKRLAGGETRTVTYSLRLDVTDLAKPVTGILDDGTIRSGVSAARTRYDQRRLPAPMAGPFTTLLEPDAEGTGPSGYGYLHLSVNRSGLVRAAGRLADGRVISLGSSVKPDGSVPLHIALKSRGRTIGSLSGAAFFDLNSADFDLASSLAWFATPTPDTEIACQPKLVGARYRPPAPGARILQVPDGIQNLAIELADGAVKKTATLTTRNVVLVEGAANPRLRLRITTNLGLFSGTVTEETAADPPRVVDCRVYGIFVPKLSKGAGYFIDGAGTSQPVVIGPPAAPE